MLPRDEIIPSGEESFAGVKYILQNMKQGSETGTLSPCKMQAAGSQFRSQETEIETALWRHPPVESFAPFSWQHKVGIRIKAFIV